jgi:hypothetical protein
LILLHQIGPLQGVDVSGSADIHLFDKKIKSPDAAIYPAQTKAPSEGGRRRPDSKHYPTLIFEVGRSQSRESLAYNAARVLLCTGRRVWTVVTIKIFTASHKLEKVTVDVWEAKLARLKIPDTKKRSQTSGNYPTIPRNQLLDNRFRPVNKAPSTFISTWYFLPTSGHLNEHEVFMACIRDTRTVGSQIDSSPSYALTVTVLVYI